MKSKLNRLFRPEADASAPENLNGGTATVEAPAKPKAVLLVRDEADARRTISNKPQLASHFELRVIHTMTATLAPDETDANGLTTPGRTIMSKNREGFEAVRRAAAAGIPIYTTGIFLDDAAGIGGVTVINNFEIERLTKNPKAPFPKATSTHCFLSQVCDNGAFAKLQELAEFKEAFGLGLVPDEEAF